MKIFSLLFVGIILGCSYMQQNGLIKNEMGQINLFDTNKHKIDLYLLSEDTKSADFVGPIFIIDTYIFNERSVFYNFDELIISLRILDFRYKTKFISQSSYTIDSSHIKSLIPQTIYIRGMRPSYQIVTFVGEMSAEQDTIFNWHMIPPYPKFNPKYNEGLIESYTKPRTYIRYPLSQEQQNELIEIFKSKGLIH